jgi:hypothetical protein
MFPYATSLPFFGNGSLGLERVAVMLKAHVPCCEPCDSGAVANSERRREDSRCSAAGSSCEQLKLLSERGAANSGRTSPVLCASCGPFRCRPARASANGDAALGHHLLQVPEAQAIGQIPSTTEQDHGSTKMPALNTTSSIPETSATVLATPKQTACDKAGSVPDPWITRSVA